MKKIFSVLSLFLVVISLASFANPKKTEDPQTLKAFNKLFAGASNVSWSKEQGYLRASFTWGDHHTVAYFDSNAQLAGSLRGLFFKELPLSVMRSMEKHFNEAVILEITEIFNEDGVRYKVILENKEKKYQVYMNSLGDMTDKTRIKI